VVVTGRSRERLDAAIAVLGGACRAVALDALDERGTAASFDELPVVHHVFVSAATVGTGPIDAPTERLRDLLGTRLWGSVFAAGRRRRR
jgi:hypothetical protein